MHILDYTWFTGQGESKKVNLLLEMQKLLKEDTLSGRRILIGTDGQKNKKRAGISYVTVVAVHNVGKGGRGFWCRVRESRTPTIRQKMFTETWHSLEVAMALDPLVDSRDNFEIHIDANTNPKYASYKYHKQVSGMVAGNGFRFILKPNAWVSSHFADFLVKSKYLK
jgi:predicted RNase H-related nuclease YkuK (DUF458 family)